MPITKHKIFKVEIIDNENISDISANEFNEFLEDANHIYVNHSTSVLIESTRISGSFSTGNKFLIISLIYNDLSSTPLNLKNTGKKIKNIVAKESKENTSIPIPNIKTDFDKELDKTTKKINEGNIRRGTGNFS